MELLHKYAINYYDTQLITSEGEKKCLHAAQEGDQNS